MAEASEPEGAEEAEPVFDTGPAAVATALDEARHDPSLRDEVAAFLSGQLGLIELQKHHLKAQFAQLRLRTVSDAARLALQGASLVLVLAVMAALAVMVGDAMDAHGLVVAGFSSPQTFAERGVTGQALAEELMGRIAAVERTANANSLSRSDDVRADSDSTVKVEIPETGVSLDEVGRYLRRWLGHETRLTGGLRDDGGGAVSLSLNMAGSDPIVVSGPSADLDKLMQAAAEKAFAIFDPVNYVQYLASRGRSDEALAAAERNLRLGGSLKQRADAYALWANVDGDATRALRKAEIAIEIDPTVMVGWMEAARSSLDLGHDEAALAYARRLIRARLEDQLRQQRPGYAMVMARGRSFIDQMTADYERLADDNSHVLLASGGSVAQQYVLKARVAALTHDGSGAELLLNRAMINDDVPSQMGLETRWAAAAGVGDWPGARVSAQALVDAAQSRSPGAFKSWLAYAQAMTGQMAQAQSLISTTPLDCYLCVRMRGLIADAAGDTPGADRWFAEAVRQGPSLPIAHLDWGRSKLARGDIAGAIAEFVKAEALGPRFADPKELWGEALMRKGDFVGAAAKFAEADKYAPRWGRNHMEWGEALMLSGRYAEARAQYVAADGMDLSRPDRTALNVLLGRTASGPLHG